MRINKGHIYKAIAMRSISDDGNTFTITYNDDKLRLTKWLTGEICEFIAPYQDIELYGDKYLTIIVKRFNFLLNN